MPKNFTPFQWAAQLKSEEVTRRQQLLKRELAKIKGVEFKYHAMDLSYVEAVFARGDRRLADALVDLAVAELHVARAEGDVLIHGLLKQLVLRILEHEADLPFDVAAAYLVGVYVLPADKHSARCRLKQGVEVLGKGRFAASGVPDDADKLPMRYAYVYIFYRNSAKRGALAVYMAQALHGYISHFLSSL